MSLAHRVAAMRNLVAIGAKRASTKARQSSSIYEYAHKCVLPTANWMRTCREAARLCADFIPPRDLPVTICGDPQLSRDRAIRHKLLQQLSLAQCFPASWPNRLFRRTCSDPMNKSPSSFRPSSPRHQRLVGTSQSTGGESCDDSRRGTILRQRLGGSPRNPAAPAEPHDCQRKYAADANIVIAATVRQSAINALVLAHCS